MTPEPTDAPTPPQFNGAPTPPAFNGAPTSPAFNGAPTAPGVPSAPPVEPTPQRKRGPKFVRVIAGIAVAIVVILLKVGAIAGVVHLFSPNHHKAGAAEAVVKSFLEADTEAIVTSDVVPGDMKSILDSSCRAAFSSGPGTRFKVDSSANNSDGSASVYVTLSSGQNITFHLVNNNGWLIDSAAC